MAYPSPRRLQLRRGNASAVSSYLGYAGELVVDTTNWTLYVHDGVTVGGYAATVNTASITGNLNSILNGTAVFGNIIPSANAVYSLGNITHQWKSLFVSNSTIYVGGVPLSIDATGNLTVNGNTIPTLAYVNTVVANVTVDLSSYALNANVTAANVGLKGYVDQANTIQSAQISSANIGIKGYVDQANTIQSAQISSANVGMKGYVDSQSFYSNTKVADYLPTYSGNIAANITKGSYTWTFGTNGALTLPESASGQANIVVPYDRSLNITTTDAETGNINQWLFNQSGLTYLPNNLYILDSQFVFFNNLGNAAQQSGKVNQNYELHVGGFYNKVWTFGYDGNLTLPTGGYLGNVWGEPSETTLAAAPGGFVAIANSSGDQYIDANDNNVQIGTNYRSGGGNVWLFYQNGWLVFPDNTVQTTAYTGYGNTQVGAYTNLSTYAYAANVTAANVGMKGYVDNAVATSGYSNVQVATYLPTYTGNVAAGNVKVSNAYRFETGNVNITNESSHLNLNPDTTANALAGVKIGGSGYLLGPNGARNLTLNYNGVFGAVGLQGNVTIGTAGSGNLFVLGNVLARDITGNNISATYFIGNGSQLTGLPSSYSNVQTAAYLNATGYNLYSNVNVQAYLSGSVTGIVPASAYSNNLGTNTKPWGNFYTYNMELAGGYFKTNGTGGISGQILKSTGDTNPPAWSNIADVISGSTGNFSFPANVTAQNFIGNISITGNVVGTSPNVTIQAGGNVWVFDNTGNLTLPTNADIIGAVTFTGNVTAPYFIGNGALLTGIAASSNYSNVNVATYLPTYSGNIANIRLGPSGVLTFADGTTQITAGGGSYSNVQVAAYLTTGVNTAAPQIQLTNATSNYIKYNNVGVGAPTFTTANVGTRIIYWSSVDANTADYAVGIDAGTLWHGIPRATSGFAFKWYGGTTQIAMLEGTGSFTIANIRLSPSGNIVFADGTVQTTAATGTYSNIQVATYLPTYTGSLNASNILVTSANITIANIQATTAATNPATGALRVMGGLGVAGAVVAGQLNSTGNVVANAISAYSLNTVANVVASVVNAGTINSAGNVLAQNLIGTIATASQTNITAVGTLASLNVTGNVNSSNFVGSTPNVQLIANTSITTFDINGNVTFPGNNVISSLGITMPTRPAFRVNGTSLYGGAQSTANVNLKGVAVSTQYNQGNYFDATTGKFTAPVAGIYEVLLNSRVNSSFNGLAQLVVLKNGLNTSGNIVAFWETTSNAAGATHFGVSGTVVLATGDYLSANILSGNITFDQNDNWSVTYLG